ncbi:MAG: hypothetical protein QM500_07780, partial [Methylococcales bacterium]
MEKRQADDLLKVRYRNDGDLFHELWATRRILRLLDFKNDLITIAIEGISEKEHSGSNEGLLVIDMTEYFGSESFVEARKIIYCQLKHSTTNPSKAWSANEISDVIEGFAMRFKGLIKSHNIKAVQEKLQFQFFTNRPISSNITKAIQSGISGKTNLLKGHALKAFNSLKTQYGADDRHFDVFLSLLKLEGKQPGRKQQDSALKTDMLSYIPEFDLNVKLRLESLIRQRMGIDFKDRPTIRKEDVLGEIGVSESQLFPAPAEYQFETKIFPREQENEIAQKIIHASKIVLIHASGGIGKSALTQRLAGLMPTGSVTVIFDGFAGGEYLRDRTPRHKHGYGLVQIANELAKQGLSDPLLPIPGTADSVYLQAFRLRLQQAVASIQSKANDALLLIVLDAADNSEMAAKARHELSFIHGLLQESPPSGCKLVVLARSEPERLGLLNLPVEYEDILLKPFNLNESALHFQQKFPDVNKQQIENFHRLTSANPRIQAYELAQAQSISEVFIQLGPTIRTIEEVIALQVDKALMHIRNEYPEKKSIDRLCFALAVLPPMIPISILSLAAKVSSACIHSFVSDLKHPLLIKDEAVQFRDEPVETWFRQTYADRSTVDDYIGLAKKLAPLAKENTYVAITLPRVLFQAQLYDELMELALDNAGLENEDVIARRDIVIRRVQYAMKAMLPKGYKKEVMQLILRAAEEVQSKDRQENFLIENGSLIAVLLEPELTLDLVFRKHIDCWYGQTLIHRVAMLASHPHFRADASGFYRQARTWLSEWAKSTDEERQDQQMNVKEIAAYALSAIHLSGAKQAVNELLRWKPKQIHFDAARLIFCELIDLAETEKITLLINAGHSRLRLLLAAAIELEKIEQYLPEKAAIKAARMIVRLGSKPVNDRGYEPSIIEIGIVVIAETLAFYQHTQLCLQLLNTYSPILPEHITSLSDTSRANAFVIAIKIYSLKAELNKVGISVNDFFEENPDKLSYEDEQKRKELKIVYERLLPWFALRTKVIVGLIEKQQVAEKIEAV